MNARAKFTKAEETIEERERERDRLEERSQYRLLSFRAPRGASFETSPFVVEEARVPFSFLLASLFFLNFFLRKRVRDVPKKQHSRNANSRGGGGGLVVFSSRRANEKKVLLLLMKDIRERDFKNEFLCVTESVFPSP